MFLKGSVISCPLKLDILNIMLPYVLSLYTQGSPMQTLTTVNKAVRQQCPGDCRSTWGCFNRHLKWSQATVLFEFLCLLFIGFLPCQVNFSY